MISQIYLGALLIAMAGGQALTFRTFAVALEGYGVVPQSVLRPAATVIIAAEAVAGIGLLLGAGWAHWPGAVLALVVAVGWTAVAAMALKRRREVINCGCFGAFLPQRLRRSVLVQDAAFVGLAGWVIAKCPLP